MENKADGIEHFNNHVVMCWTILPKLVKIVAYGEEERKHKSLHTVKLCYEYATST